MLKWACRAVVFFLFASAVAYAQEISPWTVNLSYQFKTHLRDSDREKFPVGEPLGVSLETVDPGTHFEVSVLSLRGSLAYQDHRFFRTKIDLYDLHDRNPTSDDKDIDLDEYWFVLGRESRPWQVPEKSGGYIKVGKFQKFEKQTDRHLESYGLVSTAFNRFEDQGMELGIDLGPHFYAKGSLTAGNPVFLRDPNSLAGDNGTARLFRKGSTELGSGVPILYDAEVEDFDWDDDYLEKGAGIGTRFSNEDQTRILNIMAFNYERKLQDEVDLRGTRYGADLDILTAPRVGTLNGVGGNHKREKGVNAWLYWEDFTFFMQYVDQKVARWERRGWEFEGSWQIDLPDIWHFNERRLFSKITPAVRYSELDPAQTGPKGFPASGFFWDWFKVDGGLRLDVYPGLNLTTEYAYNEFIRAGKSENLNEFLTTLVWTKRL